MRIRQLAAAVALGSAAIALSACATSLQTEVSRYQAMPAPQGQTFIVVPGGGKARPGGLEFERYAALVAQHLAAHGYRPAANAQAANMVVELGYGVDQRPDPDQRLRPDLRPRLGRLRRRLGQPLLSPVRLLGARHSITDGTIPSGTAAGSTAMSNIISQLELHIRATGSNAPLVRWPCGSSVDNKSARRTAARPGPGAVHRLPGQNGEDCPDHDPAREQRRSTRLLSLERKQEARRIVSGGPFFAMEFADVD